MLALLDRGLAWIMVIAAAVTVVLLFAGSSLIGTSSSPAAGPASGTAGQTSGAAGQTSGEVVFKSAGCGGCHTLKAAGTTGTVGPNLDQVQPSAAIVSAIVQSGSGIMPSFAGKLSDAQIAAVAAYVSSVAGH